MKVVNSIIVSFLLVILVSCGGDNNYETFEDPANGFKIDYPLDWDTTNLDVRMAFMARENFKDSTDMFGEGFSVSVFDNQGMSLQSIVDENVKMTKLYFENPEITEKKFTNDNDIACIQIEVIYQASGLHLSNTAVFVNHDHSLFTITLSAEVSKKENYETIFDDVINSLEWIEK